MTEGRRPPWGPWAAPGAPPRVHVCPGGQGGGPPLGVPGPPLGAPPDPPPGGGVRGTLNKCIILSEFRAEYVRGPPPFLGNFGGFFLIFLIFPFFWENFRKITGFFKSGPKGVPPAGRPLHADPRRENGPLEARVRPTQGPPRGQGPPVGGSTTRLGGPRARP